MWPTVIRATSGQPLASAWWARNASDRDRVSRYAGEYLLDAVSDMMKPRLASLKDRPRSRSGSTGLTSARIGRGCSVTTRQRSETFLTVIHSAPPGDKGRLIRAWEALILGNGALGGIRTHDLCLRRPDDKNHLKPAFPGTDRPGDSLLYMK